jgi:signal transduction histidine kinase
MEEQRLRRLLDVGRSLIEELDPDVVLDRLLEVAQELTGARYAAIGVLDERREMLEQFITKGIDEETHRAIGDLPHGRGVLGVLIHKPRPLRLPDVGAHPESYGFPLAHPPMHTFLGVPVRSRGEVYGNLYLTEKDGGEPFTEADEQIVATLAQWAGVAIENARLYERVEGRRTELERAVRGLEATTAIARAVGGETRLDRVLELIVKRARALVEARGLLILLQRGEDLEVASAAGEMPPGVVGRRLRSDGTIAGEVLRTLRPMRVTDVGPDRVAVHELGVDVSTALVAPLIFRGRASGVILAFDRLGPSPEFDANDEALIEAFAASAATAVHTAQSVEADRLRLGLASAERERARWARELHDETLQGLAALRMALSSGLRSDDTDRLRRSVDQAIGQISAEIKNLRALIAELRPAALDELGLLPAVDGLAERTRHDHGLEVTLDADLGGLDRLAPELESTVYRLVQESLTNVAKHAGATRVDIVLRRRGGALELEVRDDGQGFDPAVGSEGFGLTGMRERAELAGGRLEVDSGPGGTRIQAVLPEPAGPAAFGTPEPERSSAPS